MSYLINNQQKMNDLIFSDRNKNYGAYVLRSTYGNTIFKSLSFMIIGVSSILSIAIYSNHKNNLDPEKNSVSPFIHDTVYVIPFNAEPDKKEIENTREKETKKLESLVKADDKSTNIIDSTTIESSSTLTVNSTPSVITETNSLAGLGNGKNAGAGKDTADSKGKPGAINGDPKAGYEVDSQPEFEGGLNALYRFVSANLKYPQLASDEGIDGIIYVKFVVDENGKVGNLSLLNSRGYGLDEEALRVVGLIPKFKSPAKAKGLAVKVYYQLPIKFISK